MSTLISSPTPTLPPSTSNKKDDAVGQDEVQSISDKRTVETQVTTTENATTADVGWLIFCFLTYFVASSSMLVVNKIVMTMLPAPAFVVSVQYLVTALFVLMLHKCGTIVLSPMPSWSGMKQYAVIPLVFSSAIFFNGKMLELANVETFLIFRFSTPLCVAIIDFLLMGKELPHLRSLFAFLLIIAGAVFYTLSDEGFKLESYLWAIAYLGAICTEMIIVKHIFTIMEMSSWTRVLLNNILSLPFQPIFILVTKEWEKYYLLEFNIYNMCALVVSALLGVALAWSGTELRSLISATSFTLAGVVCKFVTVGINFVIWDRHANLVGTLSLLLCLIGATAYKPVSARVNGGFSQRVWNALNRFCCRGLTKVELQSPASNSGTGYDAEIKYSSLATITQMKSQEDDEVKEDKP
jgi:solute carrier family 35 protein